MDEKIRNIRRRYQAIPHDCKNYLRKYGEKFFCELCGEELIEVREATE